MRPGQHGEVVKTGILRDPHGHFMWDLFTSIMLLIGTFCVAVGMLVLFTLTDGVEYGPYRCEDRGGIKQIAAGRSGRVRSLLCNDGTIQSSRVKLHGVRWKWNRPEDEG